MMHVYNKCKEQKGFTLIELMIAMMLGLIVIGGALSIYISTIKSSSDVVKSARLNYDLDSAMQLMVNDIRRAGYWGGAIAGSVASENPFGDTQIGKKTGEGDSSCILYNYDGDSSGSNTLDDQGDDLDLNEFYGFRHNGTGIDIRSSVADAANSGCDQGTWESIVDTNKVIVSELTFDDTSSQCLNVTTSTVYAVAGACPAVATAGFSVAGDQLVEVRQIDITLIGNVVNDAPVKKTLTATVKVRNNRIFTQL